MNQEQRSYIVELPDGKEHPFDLMVDGSERDRGVSRQLQEFAPAIQEYTARLEREFDQRHPIPRMAHPTVLEFEQLLDRHRVSPSQKRFRARRIRQAAYQLYDGHVAGALSWLYMVSPQLGDRAPIACADTEASTQAVETLATQLEHGVFS